MQHRNPPFLAAQQFMRGFVIGCAAVWLQYVTECFNNSSLFHKALKEAFEQFCNKQVGGSSSAELMASFCDNLLKKVHPWPLLSEIDPFSNVQQQVLLVLS